MTMDLGFQLPGSVVRIPFSTFDKDDGSSITATNYAAEDILVYKDGDTAERASTAGYTATTDFDGKTGKQLASIDLADNTTADFWACGSEYLVAIDAVTVDSVTTGGWTARFRIGYSQAAHNTTIATLASQTSFTLTAGPAEDDALNGMWCIVHDAASAVQKAFVLIADYTGSTKTVTLAAGATFTVAAKDNFSVISPAPLQATVTGRPLDVTSTGTAGIDLANVENQGTTLSLTGTTIKTATDVETDTQDIQSKIGSPVGTVSSDIAAIEAQTDDIGAAGAGLTNVPWNASWDAQVESEAADALAAYDGPTYAELLTEIDSVQADIAGIAGGITITDVQTALTNQGYTTVRAALLDNLDATISSVITAIGALENLSAAEVETAVQAALTAQGYTMARATNLDNLDAAVSAVITAISGLENLSITGVQTALDNQGYTAARAVYLDNLPTILTVVEKIRKVTTNKVVIAVDELSVAVYEDDGTTVAFSFTVSADKLTRTPV